MIGKQPLIVPNKSFLALIGQRGGADRLSLLDWANLTLEERVNYETIERYINGLTVPTGGGKRYATVVVAASDSLHPEDADFTCTGTNDETTINAALNTMGSPDFRNIPEGKLLLMEGTYNTSGPINLPYSTNSGSTFAGTVTIEGMGFGSTKIIADDFYNVITLPTTDFRPIGVEIRSLLIQVGQVGNTPCPTPGLAGINLTDAGSVVIENVLFESNNDADDRNDDPNFMRSIIVTGCALVSIRNNFVDGSGLGGIQLNNCVLGVVSGNQTTAADSGIELFGRNILINICDNVLDVSSGIVVSATAATGSNVFPNAPNTITITGNVMDGTGIQQVDNPNGITLIGGNGCTISGNFYDGGEYFGGPAVGGYYILLEDFFDPVKNAGADCAYNTIVGNMTDDGDGNGAANPGIALLAQNTQPTHGKCGTHDNVVSSNQLAFSGGDGIYLSGALCHANIINDNVVSQWGQGTGAANSFDGIHLANGASFNNVQDNLVRFDTLSYTPGGAPPYPTGERYGINVDGASCTGNVVTNNDLRYSGATASFHDTGTGTVKNFDGSANNWNLL